MTNRKAPANAVAVLVISAVVGAVTALFLLGFLMEYGTSSGYWAEGAVNALKLGAGPLLVTGVLAAVAFGLGRRSVWLKGLAVAAALVSVGGVLVAGGQAAEVKYNNQPRLPNCARDWMLEEFRGSPEEPAVREIREAFVGLEHPWRFYGGGSSGPDGCSTTVLGVAFDEAAGHYRDEFRAAGWNVTCDDGSRLAARRGDVAIILAGRRADPDADLPGSVAITIKHTAAGASPESC